jgi:hypothetical protein
MADATLARYRYTHLRKTSKANGMKSSTQGKLLLGAIMALALSSYVAITAHSSRSAGAGIYEVEASNLSYTNLVAPAHVKGSNEMKRLALRTRR